MLYTGHSCIVCSKEFEEDDEIVACPDCGTPYHRECWSIAGDCINEQLHTAQISYQKRVSLDKFNDKLRETNDLYKDKTCEKCGAKFKFHTNICPNCGEPANSSERLEDKIDISEEARKLMLSGLIPPEIDGISSEILGEFIGKNKERYLTIFTVFSNLKKGGKKNLLSFNLAAFVFPQLYFAYRRMWGWSLAFLIIGAILNVPSIIGYLQGLSLFSPGTLIGDINTQTEAYDQLSLFCSAVMWLFYTYAFLTADKIYFNYCTKKIRLAEAQLSITDQPGGIQDENNNAEKLVLDMCVKSYGGTRIINAVLAAALSGTLTFGAIWAFVNFVVYSS